MASVLSFVLALAGVLATATAAGLLVDDVLRMRRDRSFSGSPSPFSANDGVLLTALLIAVATGRVGLSSVIWLLPAALVLGYVLSRYFPHSVVSLPGLAFSLICCVGTRGPPKVSAGDE